MIAWPNSCRHSEIRNPVRTNGKTSRRASPGRYSIHTAHNRKAAISNKNDQLIGATAVDCTDGSCCDVDTAPPSCIRPHLRERNRGCSSEEQKLTTWPPPPAWRQ